jgi:hypothetical protein
MSGGLKLARDPAPPRPPPRKTGRAALSLAQADLGIGLGVLRHRLGRCLGRGEDPMQLNGLDGPWARRYVSGSSTRPAVAVCAV